MNKYCFTCIIVIGICFSACSPANEESNDKIIASVADKNLYASDISGLVNKGAPASDSAAIVQNYVDTWVRQRAMLIKAEKEVQLDEGEIERKIADYRYDLMIYELEKQYLQKNLDTVVTEEQIQAYYAQNPANFELKQNIVQASLVSLPEKSPEIGKAKKLIKQPDERSLEELKTYCYRYASNYILGDTTWRDFDGLISNTPFREMPNKTQFLKQNTYTESTEDGVTYLLAIKNYKIASQTSPLSFVKGAIRDIILNQRKTALLRQLEQQVYKEAKEGNKIKFYQK